MNSIGKSGIVYDALFGFLFAFRYVRLLISIFSFWILYRPSKIPETPTVTPEQCAVIIPTIDPGNSWFYDCVITVAANKPGTVLIVTVGRKLLNEVETALVGIRTRFPETMFTASSCPIASKRRQLAQVIPQAPDSAKIIVLADDHVVWPSTNFLRTALAPFEDAKVGLVGTNKRVRRLDHGKGLKAFWRGFWNFLGATYLERHNFEFRASNAVDGGVAVVSGRTCLNRAEILKNPDFLHGYTNEYVLGYGPIAADDDNFITRWNVSHGWDIKFQYSADAMIETTQGEFPRFLGQCLRWVRTTWRSNCASLFTERTVWRRQPYCVYAVFLTSLVNFALFYDFLLLWTIAHTSFGTRSWGWPVAMAVWIFLSKMVKLTAYFRRHPKDLVYLPGYLLFAYYHSLIKLWALLTFGSNSWGGRNLAEIGDDSSEEVQ